MAKNPNPSQLDPGQIAKREFDDDNDAIRVNIVAAVAGGSTVDIISGDGSGDKVNVTAANAMKVDASATTQPVSAASLPLPTGASTAANQTTANASLSSIDSKLTAPLSVSSSSNGNTGAAVPAQATQIGGSDGTNLQAIKVSATGVVSVDGSATTQPVSASSLPLPTGAATSAAQTTGNSSLSSIDGKIVAVDTGAVVIASGSITVDNASGAAAVNIQDGGNSITVDAASLPLPTGAASESTLASIDGKIVAVDTGAVVIASGSVSISGTVAATQSGTWDINNISGTVSLPTGAATSAAQTTGNNSLASIDGNVIKADTDNVTISAALPAGSNTIGSINNISGTISLPTGAATEATLASLEGEVSARLSGSLVPAAFDEIALTYVTVGNGIGQIETAVYKLATVTIKTLTLSYDGSDRLSGVVAS